MDKPIVLSLLLMICCAAESATREEAGTKAGALMHPKPTHHVHVAQFPDRTELYESSPTGGIAAYVTPDAVQVMSLHLEQIQSGSDAENEYEGKGIANEHGLGMNIAKAGVILPHDRKKRERVLRGVGETVGASEEFGRALEEVALSEHRGQVGENGEAVKAKYLQNETAREENVKQDIEGAKKKPVMDKRQEEEEWGVDDPWPESMIHEML